MGLVFASVFINIMYLLGKESWKEGSTYLEPMLVNSFNQIYITQNDKKKEKKERIGMPCPKTCSIKGNIDYHYDYYFVSIQGDLITLSYFL